MWTILEREAFKRRLDYCVRSGGDPVALLVVQVSNLRRLGSWLGPDPSRQVMADIVERLAGFEAPQAPGQRPCNIAVGTLAFDEAAIILQGVLTEDIIDETARRVLALFQAPLAIVGHVVGLDVRVGVAESGHAQSAEELARWAHLAIEHQRRGGSNRVAAFRRHMLDIAGRDLELETSLRRALSRDSELYLLYQPQISLKTGGIESVEALVRWDHPGMGLTLPGEFINFAEERGMGLDICDWVMRHACWQLREWQDKGIGNVALSINLTSDHLALEEIGDRLAAILAEAKVNPRLIELEITERYAMEDGQDSLAVFQKLRKLGVSLSLDDFGTGYSSLTQLQFLPVSRLKIDRGFISGLPQDKQSLALVKGIIGLAHGMDLGVVAEGVETEEQRQCLAELGCDSFQGFLFAEPLPADAIRGMLATRQTISHFPSALQ